MSSLRSKILIAAVSLVVLCQLVTVVAVLVQAYAEAERQARGRLEVASGVVGSYLSGRQEQLQTAVRVLADDFGFRSAVASGDAETVRSVLRNHASRIRADYAVMFDAQAEPIAATSRITPSLSLISSSSDGARDTDAPEFFEHDGIIYQSVIVPVLAPVRIGWVAMGFAVDGALADTLTELTGTRVSFHGYVRAERAGHGEAPDRGAGFEHVAARSDFVSAERLPSHQLPIFVEFFLSRDDAMAGYRSLASSLIVIGLFGALLTTLTAVSLSRQLTRPLAQLLAAARRIGGGDYSAQIEVRGRDEIGELATTLGTMQQEIDLRERAIRHRVEHDALTGLPNRQALLERMESWLTEESSLRVFVVSVRGVHEVNSALGLELGDAVVQLVARRFEESVADLGFVARVADTRFCLVVTDRVETDTETLAGRLRTLFEGRPTATVPPVSVKVNIGVASGDAGAGNATTLLRKAWMASLQALGRSLPAAVYDASDDEAIARRRRIVEDLETVAERGQLAVAFQVKRAVATARFTGVEALLRWQHPELGAIPPDEFITLAESAGSIGSLTRFVLREGIRQLAEWLQQGFDLRLAVNVSARDVGDPALPIFIMSLLEEFAVPASRLELEITETAIASDLDSMLSALKLLRSLGIELAIDDFGTGFSSLSQLKRLPVQRIKIDKSFVLRLSQSTADQHMVRSIIDLAHGMGLEVVAEGVEDEESAELLAGWKCEELQGYLYSQPKNAADVTAMLAEADGLGPTASGDVVSNALLNRSGSRA